MAKLKYNLVNGQTKFVLKEGKVACSCCVPLIPDVCCMYPAAHLANGIYSEEDLPTSIDYYTNYTNDGTLISTTLLLNEGVAATEGAVFYGDPPSPTGDGIYIYFTSSTWWFSYGGQLGPTDDNCLFTDRFTNPPANATGNVRNLWSLDFYADTYVATCTDGDFVSTSTLVREGQCVWRERNGEGLITNQLYYRSNATTAEAVSFGPGRIIWAFNGQLRSDAGPYNSPAGSYGANCVVVEG